jgi:hypothetical protein
MQDVLTTAATLTEAAIALFIILGVATMSRRRPSPGQLEIEFTATPESQAEPAAVPDPWELPAPEPIPYGTQAIAPAAPEPLFPSVPYLLLLPAAPVKVEPNWAEMNPQQLRQYCQQRGIKWRNAHGKNKHLGKREMVEALGQTAAIAA